MRSFSLLDKLIFRWIWKWAKRRHPMKGRRWVANKYFTLESGNAWRLKGIHWKLIWFSDIKRRKYLWRIGSMSPMNPELQEMWIKKINFT